MQMCKNQYLEQLGSGSNYPESHCRERRQLGSHKEHLSCSAAEAQHSANPCPGKEALAASCCNCSSGGCSWLDEPGLITVCLIPSHHLHSSASTSPSIPASCPWLKGRPWAERTQAAQQAEGHTWQPGASAASQQQPLHAASLLCTAQLRG